MGNLTRPEMSIYFVLCTDKGALVKLCVLKKNGERGEAVSMTFRDGTHRLPGPVWLSQVPRWLLSPPHRPLLSEPVFSLFLREDPTLDDLFSERKSEDAQQRATWQEAWQPAARATVQAV